MNRNNIIEILGKYLTPLIVLILLTIIGVGIFSSSDLMNPSSLETPIISGLLEGYQTYDALAGLLTGGIVIISINNYQPNMSFEDKKSMIAKSGFIAMFGLFIIYAGLIFVGALYNSDFAVDISRTELLLGLSIKTLGNIGSTFLSILVALACFTTAVGIIVGTGDFFKGLFKKFQYAYLIAVIICCLLGVLIGQFDVKYIIDIALPVLMFIYPLSIVLILLNVVPEKYASKRVFRVVVLITFLFSISDVLAFAAPNINLEAITKFIPLAEKSLGWVLPAFLTFVVVNLAKKK